MGNIDDTGSPILSSLAEQLSCFALVSSPIPALGGIQSSCWGRKSSGKGRGKKGREENRNEKRRKREGKGKKRREREERREKVSEREENRKGRGREKGRMKGEGINL